MIAQASSAESSDATQRPTFPSSSLVRMMYDPNGRAAAAIHKRGSAKKRTKPERGITAHTPTASAARGWDCSIAPRRDFAKPRYSTARPQGGRRASRCKRCLDLDNPRDHPLDRDRFLASSRRRPERAQLLPLLPLQPRLLPGCPARRLHGERPDGGRLTG